ncbi:Transcriptional regulator, AbrB family [uncultured Sporomusa sp.]|uniref:Transcriptional regulator, AbrB family n=1 Tax=uncultured Sporomusa sp. TaxID=307249 RepID=A0A212LMJ1_9FIRM|nr:AbrB/MazE/SpoVT family DNA-binding domain-containing protein [uncultured Sporomusa sp.]SCM78737.1 Transcriptional regulator, AbrB family [uncultured Sporomusa sp.]
MLVELKQKSQVTIPAELLKKMKLKPGDKLEIEEKEGRLIITPVAIIPRDQLWYYSKEWQTGEMQAERQIGEGKVSLAKTKDELLKGLGLDEL